MSEASASMAFSIRRFTSRTTGASNAMSRRWLTSSSPAPALSSSMPSTIRWSGVAAPSYVRAMASGIASAELTASFTPSPGNWPRSPCYARVPMVAYLPFAAFAAAADLAGAVLVVTAHRKGLAPLRYFVAAGAGFMLAAAFVRMLPESAHVPHAFLFVLVGYFGVHLFEHTVAPHFHFGEEVHPEALLDPAAGLLALPRLRMHTCL